MLLQPKRLITGLPLSVELIPQAGSLAELGGCIEQGYGGFALLGGRIELLAGHGIVNLVIHGSLLGSYRARYGTVD